MLNYWAVLVCVAALAAAASGLEPAVRYERDAVLSAEPSNSRTFVGETPLIALHELVRVYPSTRCGGDPVPAVRGITLSLAQGECLGLLGLNGAGKTSTLAVLAGEAQPTRGDAQIMGVSLAVDAAGSTAARSSVSDSAPQADPLLNSMTVLQHLGATCEGHEAFRAELRGASQSSCASLVLMHTRPDRPPI